MNRPPGPDETFGPLFAAVQAARLFPDSKTFADALPRHSPERIMGAYGRESVAPGFDLARFVACHFDLPSARERDCVAAPGLGVREHVERLWDVLRQEPVSPEEALRGGSLLPLPRPYLVPGGRFRESYYWDSYFTLLGLEICGRRDLMRDMLENFSFLIERLGYIPNGNRGYLCTRSQPPVFSLMVEFCAGAFGDPGLPARFRSSLETEYAFWMRGCDRLQAAGETADRAVRLHGGCLNRYWDARDTPRPESWAEDLAAAAGAGDQAPRLWRDLRAACESGWDFSSRWLGDPGDLASIRTTRFLPVDLNALLCHLESTLAGACRQTGDAAAARVYDRRVKNRGDALRECFFDTSAGFFTDLCLPGLQPSEGLTLAGVWPLFLGQATDAQAAAVAARLEEDFLAPGGWVTSRTRSGQQWDAPNGWAPLQWVVYEGLRRYGHTGLARKGAQRWVRLVCSTFDATRTLYEKYDVVEAGRTAGGGEYANQPGFGWTNGVLLRLMSEGIAP